MNNALLAPESRIALKASRATTVTVSRADLSDLVRRLEASAQRGLRVAKERGAPPFFADLDIAEPGEWCWCGERRADCHMGGLGHIL